MKVIILGGGFAGISAAKAVYNKLAFEKEVDIVLIDKNSYTTMLPSLPDVLGNRIPHKYATALISELIPKGVRFINREVNEVDLDGKTVKLGNDILKYDYLIFSTGSKTNFFNFEGSNDGFYKLDCLEDALQIREDFYNSITTCDHTNAVIVGGGYTGIELACNLYNFATKLFTFAGNNNKKANITIIDRANRVLPMLSENLSSYANSKLSELGFNIITGDEVKTFENRTVTLKSGKVISNAMLYWCPGAKVSMEPKGNYKKLPDGRIVVNQNLQIPEYPEVFVAGDTAAFARKEEYLRRGVNFSAAEGKIAGKNVASIINNEKLSSFKPKDLGWVIPIFSSSVGVGFGRELRGRKGVFLHYVMCGIKNYNIKNVFKYIGYGFKFPFVGSDVKHN